MHFLFTLYITIHFLLLPFIFTLQTLNLKNQIEKIAHLIFIFEFILLFAINFNAFTDFSHPLFNEYTRENNNLYKDLTRGLSIMLFILSLVLSTICIIFCDRIYSFQILIVTFFYFISTIVLMTTIFVNNNNIPQFLYQLDSNQCKIFGFIISLISDIFIALFLSQPYHYVAQDYYSHMQDQNI